MTDSARDGFQKARMYAALVISVVGVFGCDPVSSEAVADGEFRGDQRAGPAFEVTPRRGKIIGGELVARQIEWPTAAPLSEEVRANLPKQALAELANSDVPVLVPPRLARQGQVVVGEGWYAFSGHGEGASVSLHGSGRARVYPDIKPVEPPHAVRQAGGWVTRNEGIWAVSWFEHNAAYSLELECDRPFEGACSDESYVLALAESLTYVGGKGDPR